MQCEIATINSNKNEIKNIFQNIKTIAIMGLSPNPEKDSHKVGKYLKSVGFKIYPVYPKENIILGEKVYRSLEEIPDKIDMVNIFRKPLAVLPIVEQAIKRKDVQVIWTQIGIVNNNAGELAISNGMKIVQNHCSMVEHRNLFA